MVNAALTPGSADARAAERRLAIGYAPEGRRGAVDALLALDGTLGAILRTTREPLVGQMRLTWWHGALSALDIAPPPAEPVLTALGPVIASAGLSGIALAAMVDGWEALLAEPVDLALYAEARGAALFAALASALDAQDDPRRIAAAGYGWALADLAGHTRDPALGGRAAAMASSALQTARQGRWSRPARMLGALAWLAADDLEGRSTPGSPRRVARLALLRLTGR